MDEPRIMASEVGTRATRLGSTAWHSAKSSSNLVSKYPPRLNNFCLLTPRGAGDTASVSASDHSARLSYRSFYGGAEKNL